jgi:hypothetical protein
MWNYPDAETLEWTKNLKVRGKIFGDGSSLTGVATGTETDPIWLSASAALFGNVATISGANQTLYNNYQSTSGGLGLLSGAYYGGGGGGGVNLWASGAERIYPIIDQVISGAGLMSKGTVSGSNLYLTTNLNALGLVSGGALFTSTTVSGATAFFTGGMIAKGLVSGSLIFSSGVISGAKFIINSSNSNTALGYQALASWGLTGNNNTALGYQALLNNTNGTNNNALGYQTLLNNTDGNYNFSLGANANYANTTGNYNMGIGPLSLFNNTTGNYNMGIGVNTLYSNQGGLSNIAIGSGALYSINYCNKNIGIGDGAGSYTSGANANTTASGSIYLGAYAAALRNAGANEIVIGFNAVGAGSNTCVLGNSNLTAVNTAGVYSGAGFYTTGTISGAVKAAGGFTGSGAYTTWVISGGIILSAS